MHVAIRKLIVAGITVVVLSAIASSLAYIQYALMPIREFQNFDLKDTIGGTLFFTCFIYMIYFLIFLAFSKKQTIPVYLQSLILALAAPVSIYFFIIAFGGSGNLYDVKFLAGLVIFFIIGLLLPYFQTIMFKLIN